MIYEWESHGLTPVDNNNVNVLKTRMYSIQGLQSFLAKYNFPLPAALFPDNDNNSSKIYVAQLAAKYLDTGNQTTFEQKRHRNDLLNKFFFNSEILHREDYYQFETMPISQPEESDRIREDALKEVQSVWLELKRNKFSDEMQIVQGWIDKYLPSKIYFVKWKYIKESSEVDDRINEYESYTPVNITEINIRDRAIAELRNRKIQLQTGDDFNKTTDAKNKVSNMFVKNNATNNFMISTIKNGTTTNFIITNIANKTHVSHQNHPAEQEEATPSTDVSGRTTIDQAGDVPVAEVQGNLAEQERGTQSTDSSSNVETSQKDGASVVAGQSAVVAVERPKSQPGGPTQKELLTEAERLLALKDSDRLKGNDRRHVQAFVYRVKKMPLDRVYESLAAGMKDTPSKDKGTRKGNFHSWARKGEKICRDRIS